VSYLCEVKNGAIVPLLLQLCKDNLVKDFWSEVVLFFLTTIACLVRNSMLLLVFVKLLLIFKIRTRQYYVNWKWWFGVCYFKLAIIITRQNSSRLDANLVELVLGQYVYAL